MRRHESIADQARGFINRHPSIGDALRLGIVNQSALGRLVARELGTSKVEAVVAACKRAPQRRARDHREAAVRGVMRRSRVETRTRVSTLTLGRSAQVLLRLAGAAKELLEEGRLFRLIQGSQGTVVIVDDDAVDRMMKEIPRDQVMKVRRGLVELGVVSPESIEEVPGIMSRLSSAIAAADLNVIQAMSCYTDTLFIVEERDMVRAFQAIRDVLA